MSTPEDDFRFREIIINDNNINQRFNQLRLKEDFEEVSNTINGNSTENKKLTLKKYMALFYNCIETINKVTREFQRIDERDDQVANEMSISDSFTSFTHLDDSLNLIEVPTTDTSIEEAFDSIQNNQIPATDRLFRLPAQQIFDESLIPGDISAQNATLNDRIKHFFVKYHLCKDMHTSLKQKYDRIFNYESDIEAQSDNDSEATEADLESDDSADD